MSRGIGRSAARATGDSAATAIARARDRTVAGRIADLYYGRTPTVTSVIDDADAISGLTGPARASETGILVDSLCRCGRHRERARARPPLEKHLRINPRCEVA